MAENRLKLPVLLALGIASGLLPDPAALVLLLGALSSGKVLLSPTISLWPGDPIFKLGRFASTPIVTSGAMSNAQARLALLPR